MHLIAALLLAVQGDTLRSQELAVAERAQFEIRWVTAAQARKSPKPDYYHVTSPPEQSCPMCPVAGKQLRDPRVVRWSRHFDCVQVTSLNGLQPGWPQDVFEYDRRRRIHRGAARSANDLAWRFYHAYYAATKR